MATRQSYPGERPALNAALRFDTGADWLDLLATVGNAYGRSPVERLADVDLLVEWLGHEGLVPDRAPTAGDLAAARTLREALRPLVRAAIAGEAADPAALCALNPFLADDLPVRVGVEGPGRAALSPPATTRAALARVARHAAEYLTGPADDLHACADVDCGMAYLDRTGRRRWCAANRCGVRARVRAHRSRQRD